MSISEVEKHKHILYYNFAKYKIERLDLVCNILKERDLKQKKEIDLLEQKYYKIQKYIEYFEINKKIKKKDKNIFKLNLKKYTFDEIKKDKEKAINYVQKSEKYIKKMFKEISYKEKIEYLLEG